LKVVESLGALCFVLQGRMGNIQGYAGPLPAAYMDRQLALAKKVVGRMRALGMTPVYPAFAGFVPAALKQLHPEASVTPASNWCHFPAGYCCPLMLDPADPLYRRIGAAYITTLRAELGWDSASYYIADTFNEMKPASDDPSYLTGVAASVFEGMTAADPQANWVMQAWLFFSDSRFWQPPQIQVRRGQSLRSSAGCTCPCMFCMCLLHAHSLSNTRPCGPPNILWAMSDS
jgi:alpha-N-acetylglucosaminidase